MDSRPQAGLTPPPAVQREQARSRRPAFLLILIAALLALIVWLPGGALISLWTAFRTQRALIVMLLLFALVTLSLIWSAGQRLDARVFLHFNLGRYPQWLDRAMWGVTQLGNSVTAILLAILFFLLNDRRLAVIIILGSLVLWLLVETIKILADRDRPFLAIEGTRIIGWRERGDSFPSGHTSQIFFLVTLIVRHFQFDLGLAIAFYVVAILVGFTRIYIGVHYPRDVIAGAALGTIWGIVAILVEPFWFFQRF